MPPDPLVDEEDYASSEDSDFAPDDAPDHASSADSDDDEAAGAGNDNDNGDGAKPAAATATKRKRDGAGDDDAEDAGFENSGDEAIIGKGMKKQHKRRRRDSQDDEDGGGTGGFIKTRRQRANEKAERRAAAVHGPVTVDVDALWAQMTADDTQKQQKQQQAGLAEVAAAAAAAVAAAAGGGDVSAANGTDATATPKESDDDGSGLIKIKRTYNFAGKVHTEEKMVARDSAEAKLYLAEQAAKEKDAKEKDADEDAEDAAPERPPPRKAFRSIFEPPPPPAALATGAGAAGLGRRADLDLGLRARLLARERSAQERQQAAKKLNTVEKSRMDWAGFVDKEGIQDELALAGKAKGSFAERQLFLARSEARREEEARRARLSGKA